MGRFFQTTPTQFTQDFIYQPPWELMQQAAAKKQQQYDNAIATSKLFNDIPIQHLQGVDDVANVKEKQRYYAESADMVAKAIQNDPSKVNQYMASLEALGKELSMDMKQGDLSKIQASAIAYKAWQDDEGNKEMKKTDPARYAAAEKTFLSRYVNAGGNSISQGFKGEQITKDIDWKEILANADKIRASEYDEEQDRASGLSIYRSKQSGRVVSKEAIEADIIGRLITNPSNLAALRQSQDFELATYFDEDGKLDYNATGFSGIKSVAAGNAFKTQSSSNTISGNTGAIAAMNEEGQNRRFYDNLNWQKQKDQADREDKMMIAAGADKATRLAPLEAKMAEALIAGDMKGVAVYRSQINGINGINGLTQDDLGSGYTDFNDAASKAKNDPQAKRFIEQFLPTSLKNAGLNFKDPLQASIAKEVTDKVILGILNPKDIPSYVSSRVPKKTAPVGYSEILLRAQSLKTNDDMGNSLLMRTSKNKPLESYVAQAKKELQDSKTDNNKNLRENLTEKFTTAWKSANTSFTNAGTYSSTYETAGFAPSVQGSLAMLIKDPSIRKEFLIEVKEGGKKSKLKDLSGSGVEIVNISEMSSTRSNGLPIFVGTDSKGNRHNLTANVQTPAMQSFINQAYAGMENKSNPIALSLKNPTIGVIERNLQAAKLLGKTNYDFNIKVNDKDYKIYYDTSGLGYAIDPNKINLQSKFKPGSSEWIRENSNNKIPLNPVEMGIALDNTK